MTLQERIAQLKQAQEKLAQKLAQAAKDATIRAVEKAAELTPPEADDLSGTNTRSGAMKQHWATDSVLAPQKQADRYVTALANDLEYASYVNDGHRMDRHFVPGLVINPYSDRLEYNPDGKGGIVVGTKTSYVPGRFMTDAAKQEYEKTLQAELQDLKELFK